MSLRAKSVSRLALFLCLCAWAPSDGARAEFFFRPFGGVFAGKIEEEPPPAFTSREAVGRIVAREGFRLVGPLRSHGEQIIAIGVDRRGRRMRFVIDPYEGQVLSAHRLIDYSPDYSPDVEPIERAPRALPPAEAAAAPPGEDAYRNAAPIPQSPGAPDARPRERTTAAPIEDREGPTRAPATSERRGSTRRAIAPPASRAASGAARDVPPEEAPPESASAAPRAKPAGGG